MNNINQNESGCYLLHADAFRIKSETSFRKKVLKGKAVKIEGIYTYQDTTFELDYRGNKIYNARQNGTDYYDYRNASLLINGIVHSGKFDDLHRSRTRFYITDEGKQAVIHALEVELNYDIEINDLIYNKAIWDDNPKTLPFTLVTNTILPSMDVVAAKLVSH